MTKQELRDLYMQKRQSLGEAEYLQLNHRLCENFFVSIDLSLVKVLHTFLPSIQKREPDTWLIIDRLRREFPHIRLSVPWVNTQTQQLEHFFYEGLHQIKENHWGIPEPRQGIPTPIGKIDMVLVPLLAYDNQGHRVGYGKGYYDKFLASCNRKCVTIGLSLFDAGEKIDDVMQNDISLQRVITPVESYNF